MEIYIPLFHEWILPHLSSATSYTAPSWTSWCLSCWMSPSWWYSSSHVWATMWKSLELLDLKTFSLKAFNALVGHCHIPIVCLMGNNSDQEWQIIELWLESTWSQHNGESLWIALQHLCLFWLGEPGWIPWSISVQAFLNTQEIVPFHIAYSSWANTKSTSLVVGGKSSPQQNHNIYRVGISKEDLIMTI